MQNAISKTKRFSCFQFTGDVETLKTTVPKIDLFTCENAHRTEVWVRTLRKSPEYNDTAAQQLRPGDYIFLDREEYSGYRVVKAKDFEQLYSIDPDPIYLYKGSLKVWHNGYEYVVAESPEAAVDLLLAGGYDWCKDEDNEWLALPAGERLTMNDEMLGPCTMLSCAWAARGTGFLGSTEY